MSEQAFRFCDALSKRRLARSPKTPVSTAASSWKECALEPETLGSTRRLHLLLPGGVFAIIAAIAWRWRFAGGVLLVAAGLLVVVGYFLVDGEFYTTSTLVFVMLAMAAPPVAAGVLLIESRRLAHR